MDKKPFMEQLFKLLSQSTKYYEVILDIIIFYIEKISNFTE